jgi:hypothetical protein
VERLEGPEVLGDRLGQVAVRAFAAVGGHVLPVQGVQHVPGDVEREGLLQPDDGAEVTLIAGLGEPVEGVVGAFHIGGAVLVVMQLEDPPVDEVPA